MAAVCQRRGMRRTTPNNPDKFCRDSLAEAAVRESREGSLCNDPWRGRRQSSRQWQGSGVAAVLPRRSVDGGGRGCDHINHKELRRNLSAEAAVQESREGSRCDDPRSGR